MILKRISQTVCLAASLSFHLPSMADDSIKLGMSTALTGPAQSLGLEMQMGIESYFQQVNAAGGIQGKKLELISLDDGYEPEKAAPNMRSLTEQGVLAVLGNVGTPTAIVTVPIANDNKTLLFGAFSGAGVLRQNPPARYVMNYRASYAQETAAMIDGILSAGIKPEEIAFFTQNDGYGDAGYQGAIDALKQHGFNEAAQLAHGRYTRNTLNVETGLGTILDAKVEPRAIIMVGAYAPCAAFIQQAKQELPDARFFNVSFVGSNALLQALGNQAEGVVITQVVPHYDSNLAAVQEYHSAMQAYAPKHEYGFVSLEGFLVAKLFTEGLKHADALTREGVINGLESLNNYDMGLGTAMTFSNLDHQASDKVWPTIIKGGKFEPLTDWSKVF